MRYSALTGASRQQDNARKTRARGGEAMKARYLAVLTGAALALAVPCAAQTTTTTLPPSCVETTVAELEAVTGSDPTWTAYKGLAAKKHYDTTLWTHVVRCTQTDGTMSYMAGVPNRNTKRPPAALIFTPSNPPVNRVQLIYQKNAHTTVTVLQGGSLRVTRGSDGTVRHTRVLDFFGKPIRTTTSTTVAPAGRHL